MGADLASKYWGIFSLHQWMMSSVSDDHTPATESLKTELVFMCFFTTFHWLLPGHVIYVSMMSCLYTDRVLAQAAGRDKDSRGGP